MQHVQLICSRKSDCLGCAVLLCLVCLFDLACFFLPSHLSFKKHLQAEASNTPEELSANDTGFITLQRLLGTTHVGTTYMYIGPSQLSCLGS